MDAYQLVQDTMLEGASESLAASASEEKPGFFKRLLG
jgi:hypothetical protein